MQIKVCKAVNFFRREKCLVRNIYYNSTLGQYSILIAITFKIFRTLHRFHRFLFGAMHGGESLANDLRDRDLRARLRQRQKRKLQRQQRGQLRDALKKQEAKAQEMSQSRCLLKQVADAIVCQIFAFLNVREHWKLSRTSHKIDIVSQLWQASPTQIDISDENNYYNLPRTTEQKIVKRLLRFRPFHLTIPINISSEWLKMENMEHLRELSLGGLVYGNYDYHSDFDLKWPSELIRLEKLKVAEKNYYRLPLLPSSLTHLDLSENNSGFKTFNLEKLLSSANLTALRVLKLPNCCYPRAVLRIHYCEN